MNFSANQFVKNNQKIFAYFDTVNHDKRKFYEQGNLQNYAQPYYPSQLKIHGSASWLTENQIVESGLVHQGLGEKICPYLGYLVNRDICGPSNYIFARSPSKAFSSSNDDLPDGIGHILTVATTRAGKGSGQILPNLLTWSGSVLVLDIKAENYHKSGGYRARKFGQNVHTFALLGKGGDVFNPIVSIRANLNFEEATEEELCNEEEDVSFIENLLFTPPNGDEDSFWESSAKSFIKGILLHVRTAELLTATNDPNFLHRVRERSMREVRRLICLESDSFASLLEDMGESKRTLIREAGTDLKKLLTGDGRTGHSILATLKVQTKVWSFRRVHLATYKPSGNPDGEPSPNDFTFEQLRDGNTSIYLIVPPEYLSMYRPVLRLIVGCALRELIQSHRKAKTNSEGDDKPPVLIILDEFPQLGYMQSIEEAMAFIAGYGVRFWLFVQNIGQLKREYKNSWETFIANTETKSIFGVNDIETANWVSEMLGTTTVNVYTHTSGTSNNIYGNQHNTSTSNTTSYSPRRLMTPDEVMKIPHHEQIILIKGSKPIRCARPSHFECNILSERSQIPPLKTIDF